VAAGSREENASNKIQFGSPFQIFANNRYITAYGSGFRRDDDLW
jgi:hypothetical protein